MKEIDKIQKKIVNSVPPKASGRLLLAPRTGKSKIIIDIIKRDKPESILWVSPSVKLIEKDIPEEFEKWGAKKYLKKLTTSTWASLNKVVGHFDLIVLDEEQYITDNNSVNLLDKTLTGRILSMTGTPTKHWDKKEIYKALNLPVLYNISINRAVDTGLLANYDIKVIQVNMSNEKNIPAGNKKNPFLTTEVAQYAWLSKMVQQAINQERDDIKFRILTRMRAIKNSPSKLRVAKRLLSKLEGRILIFASTIRQAEELCNATYHSKTNDNDYIKFQNGEIDRIAMVNSGGIGHTYKNIDHLVVVQADSDKNGYVSQKIARTLLQQKDYKATIWIISLLGTQDEKWVASALENFDKDKIKFINTKL